MVDEPALAGDDFSAVAAGVADRPAAGAFQVIGISGFSGHAEFNEEGADGGGADEQIAGGQTLCRLVVGRLSAIASSERVDAAVGSLLRSGVTLPDCPGDDVGVGRP